MLESVVAFLVKSTVVLALGLWACSLKRLSAAERHAVAGTGLVAVAVLAVLACLTEQPRIPAWTFVLPVENVGLGPVSAPPPMPDAVKQADPATAAMAVPPEIPARAGNWWVLGLGIYAATVVALGVSMLAGRRRVANYVRQLPVWPGPALVPDHVDVRVDGLGTPWTWGHRHPVMVLPVDFETWPRERRQAVLAHELSHIQRRDCLTDGISRWLCNVFWFHPMMWMLWSRQRRYAEEACDDAALATGTDPCEYAAALLAVARRNRDAKPMGLSVSRSDLSNRLRSILLSGARRTRMTSAKRCLLIVSATALVLPIGASTVATTGIGDSDLHGGPQSIRELRREIIVVLRYPRLHGPTVEDAEEIAKQVANVTHASPYYSSHISVFVARNGDREAPMVVIAQEDLSPRAETSAGAVWPLEEGHRLSASDDLNGERVAVIGGPIRDALFGHGANAIGEEVVIGGEPFRVKGVLAPHPPFVNVDTPYPEHMASALAKRVYVPFGLGVKLFFEGRRPSYLRVAVDDQQRIHETAAEIRELLEGRYGHAAGVLTETLTMPPPDSTRSS
ncbi:MAG: ABC transporter permease [Gammaproteobacteria bacterium]|nr:ABC transporter permease [Gammaproteobacteria bacterium]